MDTSRLALLAVRERLCIGVVCDPLADAAERWVASVGLDVIAAGATAEEAIAAAMTIVILGPEPVRRDADDADDGDVPDCNDVGRDGNADGHPDGDPDDDGPEGYYLGGTWWPC